MTNTIITTTIFGIILSTNTSFSSTNTYEHGQHTPRLPSTSYSHSYTVVKPVSDDLQEKANDGKKEKIVILQETKGGIYLDLDVQFNNPTAIQLIADNTFMTVHHNHSWGYNGQPTKFGRKALKDSSFNTSKVKNSCI